MTQRSSTNDIRWVTQRSNTNKQCFEKKLPFLHVCVYFQPVSNFVARTCSMLRSQLGSLAHSPTCTSLSAKTLGRILKLRVCVRPPTQLHHLGQASLAALPPPWTGLVGGTPTTLAPSACKPGRMGGGVQDCGAGERAVVEGGGGWRSGERCVRGKSEDGQHKENNREKTNRLKLRHRRPPPPPNPHTHGRVLLRAAVHELSQTHSVHYALPPSHPPTLPPSHTNAPSFRNVRVQQQQGHTLYFSGTNRN